MVVSISDPQLALTVLDQCVVVEPEKDILTESKLDLSDVDVSNAISFFAVANEELASCTEEDCTVLLVFGLEDINQHARLRKDVKAKVVV